VSTAAAAANHFSSEDDEVSGACQVMIASVYKFHVVAHQTKCYLCHFVVIIVVVINVKINNKLQFIHMFMATFSE